MRWDVKLLEISKEENIELNLGWFDRFLNECMVCDLERKLFEVSERDDGVERCYLLIWKIVYIKNGCEKKVNFYKLFLDYQDALDNFFLEEVPESRKTDFSLGDMQNVGEKKIKKLKWLFPLNEKRKAKKAIPRIGNLLDIYNYRQGCLLFAFYEAAKDNLECAVYEDLFDHILEHQKIEITDSIFSDEDGDEAEPYEYDEFLIANKGLNFKSLLEDMDRINDWVDLSGASLDLLNELREIGIAIKESYLELEWCMKNKAPIN